MALAYRADIDGLRALAVVPVVLFHAGFAGLPGGFVGVDVFFVISGYLITAILRREILAGDFSLLRFYERRVRRILPALIVMLLFVLAVAPLALLPSEFARLPNQALGAMLFAANIVFKHEAGYFAPAAEQMPLLHTWSLGVEEQFYIAAPLLLWGIHRVAPRLDVALLAGLLLLSFAWCVLETPSDPKAAFYLLPARAWELLAGAVLATGVVRRPQPGLLAEGLALFGVVLILGAVAGFDHTTVFPGWAAGVPVLGAVLVILAAEGTRTGWVLSRRPVVFVGLISYSLYLWHWPLIVFFRDWGFLAGMPGRIAVVGVALMAAWLSWRFVERPTRNRQGLPPRALFAGVGAGTAAVIGTAFAWAALDGWPGRFSPGIERFDAARGDISPSRARCHIPGGRRAPAQFCTLGGGVAEARVILWADSHGVEMAQAIAETGMPLVAATYSACPPALGYSPQTRPDCAAHNRAVLAHLQQTARLETVILAALYDVDDAALMAGLKQTVQALLAAGKRVVVIGPVPAPGYDVPTHLIENPDRRFAHTGPDGPAFAALFDPAATVVMPSDLFCAAGSCDLAPGGDPLLFDDNHLSMRAARLFAPRVAAVLRD